MSAIVIDHALLAEYEVGYLLAHTPDGPLAILSSWLAGRKLVAGTLPPAEETMLRLVAAETERRRARLATTAVADDAGDWPVLVGLQTEALAACEEAGARGRGGAATPARPAPCGGTMNVKVATIPGLAEARAALEPGAAWVAELLPLALPFGWSVVEAGLDGCAYRRRDGLLVISSAANCDAARRWLHVSCSRADRLPSYQDQVEVKRLFIGEDREAYSVWPRKAKHVDAHPFCLHLWCPVDGPVLPDFTRGGDMI